MKALRLILAAVVCLAVNGCDGDGSDDAGGSGGSSSSSENVATGSLILTSTSLSSSSLQGDDEVEECTDTIDTTNLSGVCITPSLVTGRAHFIDAVDGSLTATIDDSARIMRAGAAGTEESAGQIVLGANFSLNDTETVNGENELFSVYENKPTYSLISFDTYFLQTKFFTKTKYVTMLIVTHPQPFAQSDLVTTGDCVVPEADRSQDRYVEADIFSDMTFQRGDYLFCVKDAATDTCAAADYQWYDMDSDALVSTRPTNPRTNAWLLFDEPTCEANSFGTYTYSISGLKFIAELSSTFKLYADYSHGVNSTQWPDEVGAFGDDPDPENSSADGFEEPYVLYYYEPTGGSVSEGTSLEVTLDFDAEDFLFINMTESAYNSASLADVLKIVDTKTNIGFNGKGTNQQVGYNASEMAGLQVTATVTVSGGRERPAASE